MYKYIFWKNRRRPSCNVNLPGQGTTFYTSCAGQKDQDPFAGVASAIVRAGVPVVVAMQFPISDKAAVTFADQFYQMLPDCFPVDYIVAEAR